MNVTPFLTAENAADGERRVLGRSSFAWQRLGRTVRRAMTKAATPWNAKEKAIPLLQVNARRGQCRWDCDGSSMVNVRDASRANSQADGVDSSSARQECPCIGSR